MNFVFVKELNQAEIDEIYTILKDYTKDFFTPDFPDGMRVDMPFQRAFYMRENDGIASCIVYTCLDGSIHITCMATRRDLAGRDYGSRLMTAFTEHVAAYGIGSIELLTFSPRAKPQYAATVAFYEKNGFRCVNEYKDLWGEGTVVVKMRKEIAGNEARV